MNKPGFHLFTGKGGTGKTTLSSAASIYYANKGKKTLVASIDPAHSLSDCFGVDLTDQTNEPKKITKNLFGIEIVAEKALRRNSFLIKQMHDILKNLGIHDMDILESLPGIDELIAYDILVEFIENKSYDQIVVDTAPSGHALRFLSIPVHVDNWLKKSFRATRQIYGLLSVVKRQRIEGPSYNQEHKERDRMSRIYKMLANPDYSFISIVTLAERMAIAETGRDLISLLGYGFPVKEIIINQVLPKSDHGFLKSRYSIQKKNIAEIRKRFSNLRIKEIPYFESEVMGVEELGRISKMLF